LNIFLKYYINKIKIINNLEQLKLPMWIWQVAGAMLFFKFRYILLTKINKKSKTRNTQEKSVVSKLSLIDLAGSERVN